ncbi:hypothetical protein MHU86_13972 [Fragilaria crotonensis]|nr:hypothetical protein MHU86_13972 [Fragilaria crotonensis]
MTTSCNRSSSSAVAAVLLTFVIVQTLIHESSAYVSHGLRRASPSAWPKMTFLSYKVSADDLAFERDSGDSDEWLKSPTKSQEIYHLCDEQQHRQFLETHRDKIVVIKYYSASCKACKALEPRFRKLARDNRGTLSHSPIVFAQIPLTHNNDFFQDVLQLQALPAIQIYSAGALMDSFACPPKMFTTLKQKVDHWKSTLAIDPNVNKRSANEYFAYGDDDIPLQLSDMFMDDDDDDQEQHMPRNNIISTPGASEFFASAHDDIPLQLSDMFMDDNDDVQEEHVPRNNVIPTPGASEFFASAHDDIPLQLSDMFMDDDDDFVINQEELSRTILSSLPQSSTSTSHDLVPCDDNNGHARVYQHGSGELILDVGIPQNNIIRTLGGSNEFVARYGSDIPLQLSDLFHPEEEDQD